MAKGGHEANYRSMRYVALAQIGSDLLTDEQHAAQEDGRVCAISLLPGPQSPKHLKVLVARAPAILRNNVYGWFQRESRGIYGLTDIGRAAVLPLQ